MNVRFLTSSLLILSLVSSILSLANATVNEVTNGNDDGPGSLRQAVSDAVDGATISISNISRINLDEEIWIEKNLTIDGGGVTISGGNSTRIFRISKGGTLLDVTLRNMTLQNGFATHSGGAVYSLENLYLYDMEINDCRVISPGDSSTSGGAVKATGYLEVVNCRFQNNWTRSHCETLNRSAAGGAINAKKANISASYFHNNSVSNIASTTNPAKTGTVKGGAIYLSGADYTSTIRDCSFLGNYGTNVGSATGGAIYAKGLKETSFSLELIDSTFMNNRVVSTESMGNGGAVYFSRNETETTSIHVSVVGCTLYGNGASGATPGKTRGGGISYFYGDLDMVQTLVAASSDCRGGTSAGVYAHAKHDSFSARACLINGFEGLSRAQITAGGGLTGVWPLPMTVSMVIPFEMGP